MVESGLTDAELDRGKGQVRGGIVLGLEDPSSRMTRLGKSELVYPGLEPVDDVLAAIDAVTHEDIRAVAAEVLTRPKVLAVVGPYDKPDAFSSSPCSFLALSNADGSRPRTPSGGAVGVPITHRIGRAATRAAASPHPQRSRVHRLLERRAQVSETSSCEEKHADCVKLPDVPSLGQGAEVPGDPGRMSR